MTAVERAVSAFEEGFLCSQALLSTYGTRLGLDRELALKVSAAFGGGMCRMAETCGAVTGAFMVIGLRHGHTRAADEEALEKTVRLGRELVAQFESRHGSVLCKDLLGCDISTTEGRAFARDNKLFDTICPELVRGAAEILEQVLEYGSSDSQQIENGE